MKSKGRDPRGEFRTVHPPRVAPRMEGAVKNTGIKPKKKSRKA